MARAGKRLAPARPKLTRRRRKLLYAARRLLVWGCVAVVLAGLLLADHWGVFGRAPATDFRKYHGKVVRVVKVVDGDTLDVDLPDGKRRTTRIRLWGVDTPEVVKPDTPPQHFGPEASAFTKRLCEGRRVKLELDPDRTRGKYGRLLAYVLLDDGRMLNRVLVREGYGYADPRYDHGYKVEFLREQRRAIRAGRGLWATVREADLPYYWRGAIKLDGN